MLAQLTTAARSLARRPGLLSLAVANLGLGIAASTVVFSLVHGVLLRSLPYLAADRMVVLWHQFGEHGQNLPALHPLDVRDYRARARLFEEFTILRGTDWILGGPEDAEVVEAGLVEANFFRFLGVDPALGRHFEDAEDVAGGPPVVLIGHELWSRRFGADPAVVGRPLELDGRSFTVIGVLPADFALLLPPEAFWLRNAQVWRPLQIDEARQPARNTTIFSAFGRLRPGVSLEQAQAEMSAIAAQLRAEHAEHAAGGLRVRVVPFRDDVVKGARKGLWLLLGAVGLVLAIACVNVALLLLARGHRLEAEFQLRAALGASRWQLARAVLAEGVVLAAGGVTLGLLLAPPGLLLAKRLAVSHVPRLDAVSIDGTVLGLIAAVSIPAALCVTALPALRAARADLSSGMRASGSLGSSRGERWSLAALVAAQVAIAFVLVVGTRLAIHGFRTVAAVDPGFDTNGLLTARLTLPASQFADAASRRAFHTLLRERIGALPGVRSVAAVSRLPLTGSGPPQPFAYDAETALHWERVTAEWRRVSPGLFTTLRATMLAGRDFTPEDTEGATRSIIVNDALARLAFPGRPAVGERLQVGPGGGPAAFARIVGVVAHLDLSAPGAPVRPQFYEPTVAETGRFHLVVRSASRAEDLVAPVRSELGALARGVPVQEVRTMEEVAAGAMGPARLAVAVMAAFGTFAVLLAGAGVYGAASYTVIRQTRQTGIRMALGERPGGTRRRVLAHGLRTVSVGLALGALLASILARVASAWVQEVTLPDTSTYAGTAAFLAAIGLLAGWLPAERAARVDPLRALRQD